MDYTLTNSNFSIDYKAALNERQLEAVFCMEGPLLCIAGAGSGKTRTLVYRVARMIESGISPSSIILLTFTRKAAKEMITRASELAGDIIHSISGGTYHSFAYQFLRKFGSTIGLPENFSIMDEADSLSLINLIRTEAETQEGETRFPTKNTLKTTLSASINRGKTYQEAINSEIPQFAEHTEAIINIFNAYNDFKNKNGMFDFDDLLTIFIRLLEENSEAVNIVHSRYKYLLVDEYQDTNILQAKITRLLARESRNVMATGDDFQSIYSFRGADFHNILSFPEIFPGTKIIKLEENYRSGNDILQATNRLMTHAAASFQKTLFTKKKIGEKPVLVTCKSEDQQSRFVVQRIQELRLQGIPLSDVVVLFRSGFHAYQLELELKKQNIPYQKWGGFKFFEAAHIKDILAHLRLLINTRDQVSWSRALSLVEGVGTKTIRNFLETLSQSDSNETSELLAEIRVSARSKAGISALNELLNKLLQLVRKNDPSSLINLISDYYGPILKKKYDDFPKRMKDLDQLSIIASKYQDVETFLADLALEPPAKSINDNLAADESINGSPNESLVISTIHSAKGLEWNTVFIIFAIEGRFPPNYSLEDPEAIEEERRLMYVAMTRAKERLYITCPTTCWDPVTHTVFSEPSRFVLEIGDRFFQKWNLREA
ncbi:MAG: ATP-dependent helicase [Candidatus Riflebacteria bacterium]|nr:ATP-dependent helicase [Candidatus Riflebacteria bacterium]